MGIDTKGRLTARLSGATGINLRLRERLICLLKGHKWKVVHFSETDEAIECQRCWKLIEQREFGEVGE